VLTKYYMTILREFVSKTCNHIPKFTLIRLWQLATLYDINIYKVLPKISENLLAIT